MITMFKLIAQFVISGTVVVGATLVGQKIDQKWAGLLVAFPSWTIITFIFMSLNGKGLSLHEYLIASLIFMIPAAMFIASLLLFNRLNLWACLGCGLLIYLPCVFLTNRWLMIR
jgi:uncharacterized membrane protein (GlpM family)